ncbi:MAG: response regulator [Bacteroidetes bacterium]|nr:response regulator [Bacteroidota bacterium]
MKCLIVEDDFASRMILQRFLMPYGDTEIAKDGNEAIAAFQRSVQTGSRFDLVCLDIMLPGVNGQTVLKEIRSMESTSPAPAAKPARVVMTTAVSDRETVMDVIPHCDAYLVKPVKMADLISLLKRFGLIKA